MFGAQDRIICRIDCETQIQIDIAVATPESNAKILTHTQSMLLYLNSIYCYVDGKKTHYERKRTRNTRGKQTHMCIKRGLNMHMYRWMYIHEYGEIKGKTSERKRRTDFETSALPHIGALHLHTKLEFDKFIGDGFQH